MHIVPLPDTRTADKMAAMNLARIRKLKGLNQQQLADMIGVDQPTIQRAETGHSSAKLSTYRACAEALGVSLSDIFSEDMPEARMLLIAAFDALPLARQKAWLAMAELAQKEADLEAALGSSEEGKK